MQKSNVIHIKSTVNYLYLCTTYIIFCGQLVNDSKIDTTVRILQWHHNVPQVKTCSLSIALKKEEVDGGGRSKYVIRINYLTERRFGFTDLGGLEDEYMSFRLKPIRPSPFRPGPRRHMSFVQPPSSWHSGPSFFFLSSTWPWWPSNTNLV